MTGREAEIGHLEAELRRAADGTTRCVVVGGEAGIGKTRLVRELAVRSQQQARVVWGQCIELGANGVPYAPFVAALRSLAAEVGKQAVAEALGPGRAELARLLPELGEAPPESDLGRGRLFEAVAALLEHAARRRPVIMVVEDIHWADASTRDLLGFLARSLDDTRVLVVLTFRTDEMHRRHPLRPFLAELERSPRTSRLTVPRLGSDDIGTILTHLRGETPDPSMVSQVVARSDGIPFFVEELADVDPGEPMPPSLHDLLLVRVEQLSAVARQVLQTAAVAGARVVSHPALAAVTDLAPGALDDALRELVAAHQLVVDRDQQGYAFRHALVREVVHDDLLPGEHASLHERWAMAVESGRLEVEGASVQASHHWYSAHDIGRAFAASVRAAEETRAMYAPREEMLMLDRVLELWSRVADAEAQAGMDRVDVLARAGDAAWRAGEQQRAESFFDAALTAVDADDLARRARLLVRRATCGVDAARDDSRSMLAQALALLPPDPPSVERASALAKLAAWHVLRDEWQMATDLAEQAQDVARRAPDPDTESNAVNTLALARAGLGDPEGSRALFEQSRRLAEQAGSEEGLGRYRGNLGDLLLVIGSYAEAVQVSRAGREHALRQGLARSSATFMAGNEAEALIALGRWDEALGLAEQALRQDPPRTAFAHLSCQRATILLLRGDRRAGEAVDRLQPTVAWFAEMPQHAIPVAQLRAERALQAGDTEAAIGFLTEVFDRLGDRAHTSQTWQALHTLAQAVARVEASGTSRQHPARRVLDTARSVTAPSGRRQIWDRLIDAELAGGDVDAWASASRALNAPDVEGPVHLRAYADYRLADALLVQGRRDEAVPVLERAFTQADDLGARPLLARITGLARRARVAITAVAGSTQDASDPFHLTPREAEVLQLVAQGRSNATISELLFISSKTASVHVSNIMAKMGASSRAEAAAMAHAHGLVQVSPHRS